MSIHGKVKAFKDHEFELVQQKVILCSNCESSEAKYVCRQCEELSKYLCLGCSLIHPKIKQYRGHSVVATCTQQSPGPTLQIRVPQNLNELSAIFSQAVEVVCYNFTVLPWSDFRLWQTAAVLILITFMYFMVVRTIFAKYASLINIATAIGLYQWFQSTKLKLTEAEMELIDKKASPSARAATLGASMRGRMSATTGIGAAASSTTRGWNISLDQFNKDEFKDEFWYSLEDKKASLRPRGRPYSRRGAPGPAAATSKAKGDPSASAGNSAATLGVSASASVSASVRTSSDADPSTS